MKALRNIFLTVWTLWCLVGIIGNCSHYKIYDWIIAILLAPAPYLIIWFVTHKTNKQKGKISTSTTTLSKDEDKPSTPILNVKFVQQEVPQEILNGMRTHYSTQQASNDMRIIDESLEIMENTPNIETFLSRYETAMERALTLEQAKKAGIPITLPDNFSQSLLDAKAKALAGVLYRSFEKELNEINKLKTDNGKLNRINKYQEKLEGMYEDVFEFVAEDSYNDVMQQLENLKRNC